MFLDIVNSVKFVHYEKVLFNPYTQNQVLSIESNQKPM